MTPYRNPRTGANTSAPLAEGPAAGGAPGLDRSADTISPSDPGRLPGLLQ